MYLITQLEQLVCLLQKKPDEPIHILNIAIWFDDKDMDDDYANTFADFCEEKVTFYLREIIMPS